MEFLGVDQMPFDIPYYLMSITIKILIQMSIYPLETDNFVIKFGILLNLSKKFQAKILNMKNLITWINFQMLIGG